MSEKVTLPLDNLLARAVVDTITDYQTTIANMLALRAGYVGASHSQNLRIGTSSHWPHVTL